jgi:hypothetical protein
MNVRRLVGLALVGAWGCASQPHIEAAALVQKIEADKVNAHRLRGEVMVVEGVLVEKDVDTSNALLLDGQAGASISGQRKPPVRPATATIGDTEGDKEYYVECTFSQFGADRLLRTSLGSKVAVRGKLERWKESETETIPVLEDCALQ